jgi:hypothetical protein
MKSISFMRATFLFVSIAAISSVFVSCTKETPATVEQSSETYQYTAHSSDWTGPTSANTWEYYTTVPGIDAYILNNKAVLVYWDQSQTETLMPFTYAGIDYTYITGLDGNGNGYLQVDVSATGIFSSTDPSDALGNPVGFKVVVIPN